MWCEEACNTTVALCTWGEEHHHAPFQLQALLRRKVGQHPKIMGQITLRVIEKLSKKQETYRKVIKTDPCLIMFCWFGAIEDLKITVESWWCRGLTGEHRFGHLAQRRLGFWHLNLLGLTGWVSVKIAICGVFFQLTMVFSHIFSNWKFTAPKKTEVWHHSTLGVLLQGTAPQLIRDLGTVWTSTGANPIPRQNVYVYLKHP